MLSLNKQPTKLELALLLTEKKRRIEADPLKYAQEHTKQQEASKASQAIRALFWGNRVGKTQWGAMEVARYAIGEEKYREVNLPVEVWCACPSFDQQKETTQKKLAMYLPKNRIVDITYIKKNTWGEIRLDNGSVINFKSYEQGREKFQGTGKRLIWFDEEPPHDIWEEAFVRTEAGIPLDIILTMTPINGMTWTYDDLYLATGNPDIFVSTAGWDDNPFLTEKQKEQMARGLSSESLEVRKYGKFTKRVGLVCDWWMRDKHLVSISRPSPEWQIYRSADFGYSAYNCIIYIGVDKFENWFVFDGFYKKGLTTIELVEKIKEKDKGLFITNSWADSAAAQTIADLRNENITFMPVKKRAGTGIEDWDEARAQTLATQGKVDKESGKPHLFIADHLTHFDEKLGKEVNWAVQEIENLRWASNQSSDKSKENKPRWGDQPKHFIDALSYFAVSLKGNLIYFSVVDTPFLEQETQIIERGQWNLKKDEEIKEMLKNPDKLKELNLQADLELIRKAEQEARSNRYF